ncbi:PF09594 family protein [Leptospira broomii serovar Hurstbridge str. 5399]|uniref:PF09594 family protein n=1 Tax=Leptospira broomii serovar Hurstbridge str. 5399 TaxID=1049789 RepID=T0F2H0_9LEPT|nr:PF09594 family protein [Leptospira broomii serovar Hurstbridge str. 5399]
MLLSFLLFVWALPLSYFTLYHSRSDFWHLIFLFVLSILSYYIFIVYSRITAIGESLGITAGILLRLFLVFLPPILSEDVYRFLWDGFLDIHLLSPYASLPQELKVSHLSSAESALGAELVERMNSSRFYSVYPPILQLFFSASAWSMKEFQSIWVGVVVWKGILFCFELGALRLFFILRKEGENTNFLKYWLHPLVVLEGAGSGHPEPILIFFLLFAILAWKRNKGIEAGLAYIAAVFTKVIPLLLLPLILLRIRKDEKHSERMIFVLILLIPVLLISAWGMHSISLTETIQKQWKNGIGVYFKLFEYHGGLYYLWKYILSFSWYPYAAGLHLAVLGSAAILAYSFHRSRQSADPEFIAKTWVSLLGIYYLFSTTVHPWYILPLLAGAVFTKEIWPQVASAVWILSYSTYRQTPYADDPIFMILEYAPVLIVFFWEKRKLIDLKKVRI